MIALLLSAIAHAEIVDQTYLFNVRERTWGVIGFDNGAFHIVDCAAGPIEGVEKNKFQKLGNFALWSEGETVTLQYISNKKWVGVDPGFGGYFGTAYLVLNNEDRREYVVTSLDTHLYEDSVKEVVGDQVITEGQARLHMPAAPARWKAQAGASRWEPGDALICFRAGGANFYEVITADAVINPLRGDVETQFQTSRAFFPFQNELTYTVTKTKLVPTLSGLPPTSEVTLSDGSVFRENYNRRLKVGDEIVLHQFYHYTWAGSPVLLSYSLNFEAIRVDTGEAIPFSHGCSPINKSAGQTWHPVDQTRLLLVGSHTLVEVLDEAGYQKALAWDPNAKVTIAKANHGDGYILLNLTEYHSIKNPEYDDARRLWVDIRVAESDRVGTCD